MFCKAWIIHELKHFFNVAAIALLLFSCLFFPCKICNKHLQYKGREKQERTVLSLALYLSFQHLSASSFLCFLFCYCLTQFFSSTVSLSSSFTLLFTPSSSSDHRLSLFFLSLSDSPAPCICLFSLCLSLSLSIWQTEGWWVCCRSNSFIQPLSVGTSSITQWRHTNTTVFPRQIDLVVSVRKQNETRQHETPPSLYPSLHPSLIHPSVRYTRSHVDYTQRKQRQQKNKNKWTEPHNYHPTIDSFFLSECLLLHSDVYCFIKMRWAIIDWYAVTKKITWCTYRK